MRDAGEKLLESQGPGNEAVSGPVHFVLRQHVEAASTAGFWVRCRPMVRRTRAKNMVLSTSHVSALGPLARKRFILSGLPDRTG